MNPNLRPTNGWRWLDGPPEAPCRALTARLWPLYILAGAVLGAWGGYAVKGGGAPEITDVSADRSRGLAVTPATAVGAAVAEQIPQRASPANADDARGNAPSRMEAAGSAGSGKPTPAGMAGSSLPEAGALSCSFAALPLPAQLDRLHVRIEREVRISDAAQEVEAARRAWVLARTRRERRQAGQRAVLAHAELREAVR